MFLKSVPVAVAFMVPALTATIKKYSLYTASIFIQNNTYYVMMFIYVWPIYCDGDIAAF